MISWPDLPEKRVSGWTSRVRLKVVGPHCHTYRLAPILTFPRRGKGYVSSPLRGRIKVGVMWWIAFLSC